MSLLFLKRIKKGHEQDIIVLQTLYSPYLSLLLLTRDRVVWYCQCSSVDGFSKLIIKLDAIRSGMHYYQN